MLGGYLYESTFLTSHQGVGSMVQSDQKREQKIRARTLRFPWAGFARVPLNYTRALYQSTFVADFQIT